jgi:uncharacterized protein YbaR (Trm112 family)
MPLDPALLEILACPKCKGALELRKDDGSALDCHSCHLSYAIVDEIPNLVIDDAKAID